MAIYYVSRLAGGAGVGTEGDPWTLAQATAGVSAGDLIYVKADGTYDQLQTNAVLYCLTAGSTSSPITWIGYTSTIGDNGLVTLDGGTTINYGTNVGNYHQFHNFETTNAAAVGFYTTNDGSKYTNCHAHDSAGTGFGTNGGLRAQFNLCSAYDNTGNGFDMDASDACNMCIAYNNGGSGFDFNGVDNSVCYSCISYGNTGPQYNSQIGYYFNCIADGEDVADGFTITSSTNNTVIVNCIVYDCVEGINVNQGSNPGVGQDCYGLATIEGVLFYGNVTNYDTANTDVDVIGDSCVFASFDPFTDGPNHDYTLSDTSEARNAGFDITDNIKV